MSPRVEELIGRIAGDLAVKMSPLPPDQAQLSVDLTRKLFDEPLMLDQAVLDHPDYEETVDAIGTDEELGWIAPSKGWGPTIAAGDRWTQLSGRGLPASVIVSAAAELRARAINPTGDALSTAAIRNIDRCRQVARRKKPSVLTVLGFSGVVLPPGGSLELPWGIFQSRNGWYGVAEALRFRTTHCVLLADHQLPIEIYAKPPGDSKVIDAHSDWMDLTSRLVILSLVLSGRERSITPLPTFQFTIAPFEAPLSAGAPGFLAPAPALVDIDEADGAEVRRWAGIIHDRYTPKLEVAVKRLIAALAHRTDPADRLIDAVTAWEALFGSEQEASLRVSGSIGWLLSRLNANHRLELQREASEIYGRRSLVVHGRPVELSKVHASADRATLLALLSLRVIFEERPDLIPMESKDRSRTLLFEARTGP